MKINGKDFVKVGTFGVDAGLCWIGDPCYCVTPDCSSHPAQTWDEFCDILKQEESNGITVFDSGVCSSTGYGDGVYNVYAHYYDGRVSALFIDFMGIFEPNEEEEEEEENTCGCGKCDYCIDFFDNK